MPIRFKCDSCGKALKVDDSKAGKRVKCPGCTEVITIPEVGEEEEEVVVAKPKPKPKPRPEEYEEDEDEEDDEDEDEMPKKRKGSAKRKRTDDDGDDDRELASPFLRFRGWFVDVLALFVFLLPGLALFALGVNQTPPPVPGGQPDPTFLLIGMGLIFLGILVYFVAELYFAARSQSIGKWILKMQVLDFETDEPAGFVKTFLLRGVVNGILCNIIPFYFFVDVLFVFGEDNRCLHDKLAGTYVVKM